MFCEITRSILPKLWLGFMKQFQFSASPQNIHLLISFKLKQFIINSEYSEKGAHHTQFKVLFQEDYWVNLSSVATAITVVTVFCFFLPYTREVVKAYPLLKAKASCQPSAQSVADSIFSARWGFPPEATEAQKLVPFKKHVMAPSSEWLWCVYVVWSMYCDIKSGNSLSAW